MKWREAAALTVAMSCLSSCAAGMTGTMPHNRGDARIAVAESEKKAGDSTDSSPSQNPPGEVAIPETSDKEIEKREKATNQGPCFHVKTKEKVVALTFDDGPHPHYTDEILALLEQYRAKATFFVVGKNLELYGAVAKRVTDAGHEIGNHTYDHPTLSAITPGELSGQIEKNEKLIEKLTGGKCLYFRPPEGFCGKYVRDVIRKKGYQAILWDVDTRDWAGTPSESIIKNVMKSVHPGSIVLFHDYVGKHNTTIAALREILPRLAAEGYRFVTITELLSYGSEGSSAPSADD